MTDDGEQRSDDKKQSAKGIEHSVTDDIQRLSARGSLIGFYPIKLPPPLPALKARGPEGSAYSSERGGP